MRARSGPAACPLKKLRFAGRNYTALDSGAAILKTKPHG